MWTGRNCTEYFEHTLMLSSSKLYLYGERKIKNKQLVAASFQFIYFPPKIRGNSFSDEESTDYLCRLQGNFVFLFFHYLYGDVV